MQVGRALLGGIGVVAGLGAGLAALLVTPDAGPARPAPLGPATAAAAATAPARPGAPRLLPPVAAAPASSGADTTGSVAAPAPTVTAALGEASTLTPAAGARRAAEHLAACDRPGEVLAAGAALAGDPELRPLLEAEARRLRVAAEPALRARGLLLLAALGAVDVAGWRDAVAREPDPAARAAIVDAPPFRRDPRADAEVARALVDVAAHDPAPTVRAAALRALPRAVDDGQRAAVVAALADPAAEVRGTAAAWLRGARPSDPAAARGLLAVAGRATEELPVRRAAVMALLRIEDRHPGALTAAGSSLAAVQALLEQVSDDAD